MFLTQTHKQQFLFCHLFCFFFFFVTCWIILFLLQKRRQNWLTFSNPGKLWKSLCLCVCVFELSQSCSRNVVQWSSIMPAFCSPFPPKVKRQDRKEKSDSVLPFSGFPLLSKSCRFCSYLPSLYVYPPLQNTGAGIRLTFDLLFFPPFACTCW